MVKQDKFFLCQPDREKSCGACCGLYNFVDHSRDFITSILRKRKKTLYHWKGTLEEYRHYMEKEEKPYILFPTIYTCPFLTFLDDEGEKIGCYLHPAVNNGNDLRDVAFYGSKICNEHRCVSYFYYRAVEIEAVIRFTHDWYIYGMVLHDIDFVKSFFKLIEEQISRGVKIEDLGNKEVQRGFEKYFALKEKWMYKENGMKILDKYEFHGNEYRIRKIETFGILDEKDDHYKIIRSLESNFKNKREVEEAVAFIDKIVKIVADAIVTSDNARVGVL